MDIQRSIDRLKNNKLIDLAGLYGIHSTAGVAVSTLYSETENSGGNGMTRIYPLVQKLGVATEAENCLGDNQKQNVKNLKNIISLSEIPLIRKSCIQAAMKRADGGTQYFCKSSTSSAKELSDSCLTAEMVDYTWWAFHKAIYCLSDPKKPLDPLTVFEKMNNESAFHMQVAGRGGVGIGQMTSSGIGGVNETDRIQQVIDSKNPNCAPFKKALKDLKPKNALNYCALIEPNDGLARNLIYSISYFLFMRDNRMKSFDAALNKAGVEDARFANLGALAAYSRHGLKVQPDLISALSKSGNDYQRFYKEVKKTVPYISEVSNKSKDILDETGFNSIEQCLDPVQMQK